METIVVFGFIVFSPPPSDLSEAVIHVRLIDTTYVDAPAETRAEQDIDGPDTEMSDSGLRFRLPETRLEANRLYEVWVHVDMDRSGDISAGDYLSTKSHVLPARSGTVRMVVDVDLI